MYPCIYVCICRADIKPKNASVCVLAIRAKQIASFVVLLYQYLTFGLVFCLQPLFFWFFFLLGLRNYHPSEREKRTRHFTGKSGKWLCGRPGKIEGKGADNSPADG